MLKHSVKSMRTNDLHRGSFLIFANKNAENSAFHRKYRT